MNFRFLSGLVLLLVFVTAVACADAQDESSSTASSSADSQSYFEVWAVDQSGTSDGPSADSGGLIYILDGAAISENASKANPEVIDLAEAASKAGCNAPKTPHMVLANHTTQNPLDFRYSSASHVVLANVGSGDTFFIDVDSRSIVGCVNTIGGFN